MGTFLCNNNAHGRAPLEDTIAIHFLIFQVFEFCGPVQTFQAQLVSAITLSSDQRMVPRACQNNSQETYPLELYQCL